MTPPSSTAILIAQSSTPTPHLDVSQKMGQIVGVLFVVIIVLVVVKKLRGGGAKR